MSGITKRIGSIKFSCVSPEEIRKMSATSVITADTYDDEGYPLERGLMDPHMGVIEPGLRCLTCYGKVDECPGHFGHIDLALPVIHVGFVKDIKMLLESTCCQCGRLMLSEDQIKDRRESMDLMEDLGAGTIDVKAFSKETAKNASGKGVCPYCGAEQIKIKLDKPTTFREVETNTKLTAKEVRERLERIPDEDLVTMGIDPATCRPEWMVLTALAVPPVTVRPSITLDSGDRSEDDLTHKLVDVLRINQRLRENRDAGAPQLIVEDLWELLQYHVTTYFDNQTSGIPPARHRSGRPLKTLAQRLKGKEGRFRSNLSGKRVNFSARTVISPDPLLSINQVGVPVFAAKELTVPLRINDNNLPMALVMVALGNDPTPETLANLRAEDIVAIPEAPSYGESEEAEGFIPEPMSTEFYDNLRERVSEAIVAFAKKYGTVSYYIPGVNYVIRTNERRIRVSESTKPKALSFIIEDYKRSVENEENFAYIIERQLIDGDVVLFNRQPSLHRMSMMAHRVCIMQGKTFRFNLCDCPPYNADFDGDEMNLHVLQSDEARAEARILMQVQENILSPRYGGPIIGAIHDHITGAYFLTRGNPRFNKFEAANIMFKLPNKSVDPEFGIDMPEPLIDENGNEYWTGYQLFSCVLPHNEKDKLGEPRPFNMRFESNVKDTVVIKDGQLIDGTIDVKAIGNSKGKILDRIARDYGADRAAKFINQVTRLALGALMNHGFSTGISDEDIPEEAALQIDEHSEECIQRVQDLIDSYNDGTLAQMPGRSLKETLEVNIMGALSEARDGAGRIAGEHLGMDNPAVIMAKAGARGSMLNLSQMAGCVGQQSVRGARLSRGYKGRTLSHFAKGDLGAYAKGFCKNSYKSGLSPTEFFFHAMGGREGLVDTAVRTSRSGYMQRRLVSALEDLKLTSDGTVRNTVGTIVQFKYGEDGVDPARTVRGKAIDYDDLFAEVLGDRVSTIVHVDEKDVGSDYGTLEKDEMEYIEDDSDNEDGDSDNMDYDEGGE